MNTQNFIIEKLEEKIGRHDTNLLLYGISLMGVVISSFFVVKQPLFWLMFYPSIFFHQWSFERLNKKYLKRKGGNSFYLRPPQV